jgi:hypothetical protein
MGVVLSLQLVLRLTELERSVWPEATDCDVEFSLIESGRLPSFLG